MAVDRPAPAGAALRAVLAASRRDLGIAAFVAGLILSVLSLDASASLDAQHGLGVVTWLALLVALRGEPARVRAQVAVVVVFATAVEYAFSPLLGVYSYRLGNVPSFVPPGHGLVYLCALSLGRSPLFSRFQRPIVTLTLVGAGTWAAYGAVVASRRDLVGLLFFLVLARFLLVGRAPPVYAGAFLICTYLELVGTALGTWTWAVQDPFTGTLGIGNPPSGIPGGYCVFDAAALTACPVVLRLAARLRRTPHEPVAEPELAVMPP